MLSRAWWPLYYAARGRACSLLVPKSGTGRATNAWISDDMRGLRCIWYAHTDVAEMMLVFHYKKSAISIKYFRRGTCAFAANSRHILMHMATSADAADARLHYLLRYDGPFNDTIKQDCACWPATPFQNAKACWISPGRWPHAMPPIRKVIKERTFFS